MVVGFSGDLFLSKEAGGNTHRLDGLAQSFFFPFFLFINEVFDDVELVVVLNCFYQ